ncbi:MAG: TrmH family RNA methyltransferase [bacterium]|nr:TrmH family RNA methyltransferase [bacterium]
MLQNRNPHVIPEATSGSEGYPGSLFIIAHNIRSLHNVGSIFRTADSLGVHKLYLTGYTGTPPDPRLAKVALGAEEFVPWGYTKSVVRLVKKLRQEMPGIRIAALENNVTYKTTELKDYQPSFPLALIIGEETKGNTKKILDLCDDILEIPMQGKKESLNVSVACGIAMYALMSK